MRRWPRLATCGCPLPWGVDPARAVLPDPGAGRAPLQPAGALCAHGRRATAATCRDVPAWVGATGGSVGLALSSGTRSRCPGLACWRADRSPHALALLRLESDARTAVAVAALDGGRPPRRQRARLLRHYRQRGDQHVATALLPAVRAGRCPRMGGAGLAPSASMPRRRVVPAACTPAAGEHCDGLHAQPQAFGDRAAGGDASLRCLCAGPRSGPRRSDCTPNAGATDRSWPPQCPRLAPAALGGGRPLRMAHGRWAGALGGSHSGAWAADTIAVVGKPRRAHRHRASIALAGHAASYPTPEPASTAAPAGRGTAAGGRGGFARAVQVGTPCA